MERFAFGPFVFDSLREVLLRDGRLIPLNNKATRLLAALLQSPGKAVEKATLMDAAWPDTAIEESNLSVQIAALRKLLGAAHDGGEWIVTVPRVGYRFAGQVSDADARQERLDGPDARALIAVLPFGIVSEESGKEYLADGITDDIITALTRYRWFRVVARGSAFALRHREGDLADTARMLNARYALHGSVHYATRRLRISVHLVDAAGGGHLWAERYDLEFADVFAIQDEIAERVAAALEPALLQSESRLAAIRHTGNITAWDLVRQGMWHFHKVTHEGHRTARDLFRRSCNIDPDLPEAHSWLGRVCAGMIAYGWSEDPVADGREGMDSAMRAAALDPRDPYSHYALAITNCYAGSANTAALSAQNAIALNPSFALGHLVLGMARLFDGDPQCAIAPLEHGLALNPNDPQNITWQNLLAYAQLLVGDLEHALDSAKQALSVRPVFRPTFETLACCTVALDRAKEAHQWFTRMQELDGPKSHFLAPLKRNNPDYAKRIARMLGSAKQ